MCWPILFSNCNKYFRKDIDLFTSEEDHNQNIIENIPNETLSFRSKIHNLKGFERSFEEKTDILSRSLKYVVSFILKYLLILLEINSLFCFKV